MKIAIVVVALLALLIATGLLVLSGLGARAEKEAVAAFESTGTASSLAALYPTAATTNASATRLEALTPSLGIDFGRQTPYAPFDQATAGAVSKWLDEQRTSADDSITPLPAELREWLRRHESAISTVAHHLRTSDAPQWPIVPDGPGREQLPNLQSHMRLLRVLSLASLHAESLGDHARAWELQEAAWRLSASVYARPELISRLIGVAGIRLVAANARKLEPPAPAWLREIDELRIREGILDSARNEFAMMNRRMGTGGLQERKAGVRNVTGSIEKPISRWISADIAAATAQELRHLTTADPCSLDVAAAHERIEERLSFVARRFNFMTPSLLNAFVRGANTEIAIDGTMKVLELKAARAAGQPFSTQRSASPCAGAGWKYRAGVGSGVLQFTGKVPEDPKMPTGSRIPIHFVVR